VSRARPTWHTGALTGDWSALLDLLADDVEIVMPFGQQWAGLQHGKTNAAELFRHAAEDLVIRLDQTPTIGPLVDGNNRFAWELRGSGTVGGKETSVSICLWFTVRGDGRIVSIHEYATRPAP